MEPVISRLSAVESNHTAVVNKCKKKKKKTQLFHKLEKNTEIYLSEGDKIS